MEITKDTTEKSHSQYSDVDVSRYYCTEIKQLCFINTTKGPSVNHTERYRYEPCSKYLLRETRSNTGTLGERNLSLPFKLPDSTVKKMSFSSIVVVIVALASALFLLTNNELPVDEFYLLN